MGQGAGRSVNPGAQQLVVHVLGLDGAEADPLDRRLVQDPPDEPGEGQGTRDMRPAGAALRPAPVVGADVDPGQHDLAVARGERAVDVGQDHLGRQAPLRPPGPRDDAVGAVEGAAVLDLDEGTGPLDRRAVVRSAVESRACHGLDPRQGWQGSLERRMRAVSVVAMVVDLQQHLQLGQERGLVLVGDQAGGGVDGGEHLRVHLDRAARHDDLCVGVRPSGAADG